MKIYNATVEVDRRDLDLEHVDDVMVELEAFGAAIGQSRRGYASARISLPGTSLPQAAAAAIAVVERALGATALYCEVMTEKEFTAREGWGDFDDLVSVTEAAELRGVSRQAILKQVERGTLPATKVGREWVIPRAAVLTSEPMS